MALKGNLRDFTITQLLNLVNLAQKTGTLVIEGSDDTARVIRIGLQSDSRNDTTARYAPGARLA